MGKIQVIPDNKFINFEEKETLLSALLKSKTKISHSCDGNGTCTTCRVFIHEGLQNLEKRNDLEQEAATDRKFAENERLSCQIEAKEGLIIEIPY